jgi:hypothetical protein
MKRILALSSLLLSSVNLSAEPLKGLDFLGLGKLNCVDVATTLPERTVIGLLYGGTFGDPTACLTKLLETKKVIVVRAHMINGPGSRNKALQKEESRPTDFLSIEKYARQYQETMDKFPSVRCYISPVLEYDLKKTDIEKAVAAAKKGAPRCEVVLNPYSGDTLPGYKVERHGNKAKANFISNDGESLFQSNSVEYVKGGSDIVFGWFPELNLRYEGMKTFIPPLRRTCQPTKALYQQAYQLLQAEEKKPRAPAVCKTVKEIKSPNLFKTNAESYCNNDKRGNRGLFISSYNNASYDVLSAEGQKIGCARYYGPYEGKGSRSYIGSCSGENPVELRKQLGSEWGFLKRGSECFLFNSIRRKGYYK